MLFFSTTYLVQRITSWLRIARFGSPWLGEGGVYFFCNRAVHRRYSLVNAPLMLLRRRRFGSGGPGWEGVVLFFRQQATAQIIILSY